MGAQGKDTGGLRVARRSQGRSQRVRGWLLAAALCTAAGQNDGELAGADSGHGEGWARGYGLIPPPIEGLGG